MFYETVETKVKNLYINLQKKRKHTHTHTIFQGFSFINLPLYVIISIDHIIYDHANVVSLTA